MHTLFLFETMKVRDPGLDGKIILKWVLKSRMLKWVYLMQLAQGKVKW